MGPVLLPPPNVDMQTGEGIETKNTVLPPPEPMKEISRKQKLRARGQGKANKAEVQTIQRALSEQFDMPAFMIDVESGASFVDRFNFSFSDTDEEIFKQFNEKYPNGRIGRVRLPPRKVTRKGKESYAERGSRLVYRTDIDDANSLLKTVEDFGTSMGDVADISGHIPELAGTAAAAYFTSGASLFVQAAGMGIGAGLGHLVKEAGEEIGGDQLQPFLPNEDEESSVLGDTMRKSLFTTGAVLALGSGLKLADILSGKGLLSTHPEIRALEDHWKAGKAALKRKGATPPPEPNVAQLRPEDMITARLNAQAVSTTKAAQHRITEQQSGVLTATEQAAGAKTTSLQTERIVQKGVQKVYEKERNRLLNDFDQTTGKTRTTNRQGDAALKTTFADKRNGFLGRSRNEVNNREGVVNRVAVAEKPIFDVTPAMEEINTLRARVTAELADAGDDVALRPIATRLNRAFNAVEQLSQNPRIAYRELRALRSEVGDLIEKWPWQASMNSSSARALYKSLSRVMESPVNSAPKFVIAHRAANAVSSARFDVLEMKEFQELTKSGITGSMVKKYAKPGAFSNGFMRLANSDTGFLKGTVPQDKLDVFKSSVRQQMILSKKGGITGEYLKEWKAADPEGWKFLVPSKQIEQQMFKTAKSLDNLANSTLSEAMKANTGRTSGAILRSKNQNPSEVNKWVSQMDDDTKLALRTSIYDDILTNSTKEGKFGVLTLDKKKLSGLIDQYKKNGIWDSQILSKDDRLILKGLESYLKLTQGLGADPGVSLEAAQAITQLKSPFTFIAGIHKIGVNSLVARFLMSDIGHKIMLGTGKEAFSRNPLLSTAIISKGLLEGVEQGDVPLADKAGLLMNETNIRNQDVAAQIEQEQ